MDQMSQPGIGPQSIEHSGERLYIPLARCGPIRWVTHERAVITKRGERKRRCGAEGEAAIIRAHSS